MEPSRGLEADAAADSNAPSGSRDSPAQGLDSESGLWQVRRRAPALVLWVGALFFVVTSLAGVRLHYSPVPFWDSWGGNVIAYRDATNGLWEFLHAIWRPHNEHRIVVPKLLFFANNAAFGGSNAVLVALNMALAATVAGLMALFAWRLHPTQSLRRSSLIALSVVSAFSWTQNENFVWEFQSQFFLAPLFAAGSFYCASHAAAVDWKIGPSALAVGFAGLSMLSMGAGLASLPILCVLMLVLRAPRRIWMPSAVTTAIALVVYLDDLPRQTIPDAPAPLHEEIARAGQYFFTFLGGPAYYLTSNVDLAQAAGAAFLVLAALLALRLIGPGSNPFQIGTLAVIAFVVADGILATVARSDLGVQQALSSRYQTPVLLGWTALAMLASVLPMGGSGERTWRVALVCLSGLVILLPSQLTALNGPDVSDPNGQFSPTGKLVRGLALEMGVNDEGQLGLLYPDVAALRDIGEFSVDQNLAVFGSLLEGYREALGTTLPPSAAIDCVGAIDDQAPLASDEGWRTIEGWAFDEADQTRPAVVVFTDTADVVVGLAVTGFRRDDVAAAEGDSARHSGYVGYVMSTAGDVEAKCPQHSWKAA